MTGLSLHKRGWWIAVLVITAIFVAVFLLASKPQPASGPTHSTSVFIEEMQGDPSVSQDLYIEPQTAGASEVQVGYAIFESPGFIVVHANDQGVPGSVIGASERIDGRVEHVRFDLDTPLQEGGVYFAMLVIDDGDGVFEEGEDTPLIDEKGVVSLVSFQALADATPETQPVTP